MPYLKITQRGTDIDRAPDYQTVLDSRWPLLEFHEKQIDYTFYPTGVDGYHVIKLFDHNNNSVPGFDFYQDNSVVDPAYNTVFNTYGLIITKNSVYASSLFVAASLPTMQPYHLKGRLRLYKTNFDSHFKADTISIAPSQDVDQVKTGLKIIDENKPGANLRKPDYDNYSLNTDAKAMSIHMMDSILPDATTHLVNINHDLGYLPTFFAWQISTVNGGAYTTPLEGQDAISSVDALSFANTITLSFRGVQSILVNRLAFVILKDPLVATL